jgi:hypothetical protein
MPVTEARLVRSGVNRFDVASVAAGLRLSPTAHLAASGDCNWPPQLAVLGESSPAADTHSWSIPTS